jgi:hypothetical protein
MADYTRRDALKLSALTAVASLAASVPAKAASSDEGGAQSDSAAPNGKSMFPPFAFDLEASREGTIYEQRQVFTPHPITIDRMAIVTTTGCRGRDHQSSITIGVHPAVNFVLKDCTVYEKSLTIPLTSRSFQLQIRSAGFDPGERIHGLLTLEYH